MIRVVYFILIRPVHLKVIWTVHLKCRNHLAALLKINSMEIIDNKLIGELLVKAMASARLRQNLDLRTSGADGSQRMLRMC